MAPFSSLFASKLNTQALLSGGFPTPSVLARGRVELQRVKKLRQTMNALQTTKTRATSKTHHNGELLDFSLNTQFWIGFVFFTDTA